VATTTYTNSRSGRAESFWPISALIMALVQVAGFSTNLAMGRSSFGAPVYVHIHAFLFFGWVLLFLLQSFLAERAGMALHRRLGWLATGWIPAMIFVGTFVTVAMVRQGRVPFFFQPLYFLVMDPMTVLTFGGLAGAAIMLRRQTQWHRRLMFCSMAILTGPGFGRLLPMPFLIPYAGQAAAAATLVFPLAGVIRDLKRRGKVHPAWLWGISAIVGSQILVSAIIYSPLGDAIYAIATQGSPGAAVAPMAYPPFPA
jgi:hypothetical protein